MAPRNGRSMGFSPNLAHAASTFRRLTFILPQIHVSATLTTLLPSPTHLCNNHPKARGLSSQTLHLEILSTLPSEQRYEVVDGILILQPGMPHGKKIHQSIITNLPTMFSRLLKECIVSAGVDMETAAIDSGPSSSRTPPRRRSSRITNSGRNREADRTEQGQDQNDPFLNVRVPGTMIKPANTDSSSSPPHKSRKHVGLKLGECVIVMELTSPETRQIDMEVKWQQYFLSGIDIYIIIDVAPLGEHGGVSTVIVGSLMDDSVSIRSPNGYPGVYPRRGQSSRSSYYKREYNGDESIHLHGIPYIGWPSDLITPNVLGDPKAVERRAVKTSRDNVNRYEKEKRGRLEERRLRIALEAQVRRLNRELGSSSRSGTPPPERQGHRRHRSPDRRTGRSSCSE